MAQLVSHAIKARNTARKIHFEQVPPIGTVIDYYGHDLTLIEVKDYIRKDGQQSVILVWRRTDGIVGTSGLSSKGLSYGVGESKNA
jgi:hypothetical protein